MAGVYPMLLDERCFFLAVDFDEGDWAADARAFLETCERLKVPAVLERSRSGKGGHVWVFFAEAIPATLGFPPPEPQYLQGVQRIAHRLQRLQARRPDPALR